jgi:hypothetical protein
VKVLGWITTGVLILAVVGAVVVGVRSIPDARRYAKIRQM